MLTIPTVTSRDGSLVREEKVVGRVGDEFIADRGPQHDVLGKDRARKLSGCFVDVDGVGQVAAFCRGAENVSDRLEGTTNKATLCGYEGLVTVGVVKQSCEERAERPPDHPLPEIHERDGEIILEVVGNAGQDVGCHDSVYGVQKQAVQDRPVLVDGRAGYAGLFGDAKGCDRAGSLGEK